MSACIQVALGTRFGRWSSLSQQKTVNTLSGKKSKWLCRCECGTERFVLYSNLARGISRSCGCLNDERRSAGIHGHARSVAKSKTYIAWCNMHSRCSNENNKRFASYGGRGIAVSKRWAKFENFLADMGECPDGLTLDRSNNNRNYCKANCRWSTPEAQCRNKTNTIRVSAFGETKLLIDWVSGTRLKYTTAWMRIFSLGWPPERALSEVRFP